MKTRSTRSILAASGAKLSAALALLAAASAGNAAVITSTGDPLLSGASLINFSEVAVGTLNPTINGVSFVGIGAQLNTIDSGFPGQTTPVLGNSAIPPFNSTSGVSFDILFGTDVSAFSVDIAAINGSATSMSAYDDNDVLLETVAMPADGGVTHTWGLGGYASLIARVRITTDDFFFTDNLNYVEAGGSVPEPGSLALAGLALLGLAAAQRRRA